MTAFRKLALKDMASAAAVHRASYDRALPWLAGRYTPDEDSAFYRTQMFPACQIWGAEKQSKLVGIIAFRQDWIDQLYILPDAQGNGLGSDLLEIAQDAFPLLNLWTFQRNEKARRFYEFHDFRKVKETKGMRNEEKEPDVLYRWERG